MTPLKTEAVPAARVQFRIFVGSYEHNLLCLSLLLSEAQPVFQPIFHFQAHSLSIKSIDLARRYLVTGSNDEHIRIYDLQKRKELGTLLSHQGTVTTLKFSKEGIYARAPKPNDAEAPAVADNDAVSTDKSGRWLLSGSEDGKIIIWRTKDWELFGTLKGHTGRVNDVAIHPSGRVAISVAQDLTIRLWNLMTAKKAAVLKIRGKDHLGQQGEFVRWSFDGKTFMVGLLDRILVYETAHARILKKVKFASTLMCMETVQIGANEWLATGHGDGSIAFYRLLDLLAETENTSEDKVWEKQPELVDPEFRLQGHTNRIKDITLINHPVETNGVPYMVSVSSDGNIVVWDLSENVRDQVAVYSSGERLNCVAVCPENVEKVSTMKKRANDLEDAPSELEYETDGEEVKRVMASRKKGKKKKRKVLISLE